MPVQPEWIAEIRARLDSIDRKRLALIVGALVLAVLILALCSRPKPPRPADVKAKVTIEKVVTETKQDYATDVLDLSEDTHHATKVIRERTSRAVSHLRKAAAAPSGDPDRAFYLGMCQSRFYRDAPECDGYGGGPEGDRPSAGS